MTTELAVRLLIAIYDSQVAHNETHTLRLRLERFLCGQLPSRSEVYTPLNPETFEAPKEGAA